MKKTLNYLFAAIALIAAASCQKEPQPGAVYSGIQMITCSFDDVGTKATLDGYTPKWAKGDVIQLYDNESHSTTITVPDADDGKTWFSFAKPTELTGSTVYAVYPASAANGMDGSKICVKIPTSTDGSFAQAHITVAEGTTSLSFKNVVSLLKIETEGYTKGINIASGTANISGDIKVKYSTSSLDIEAGSSPAKGVTLVSSSGGVKYVAVVPGVKFNDLTFTVVDNYNSWAQKKSTKDYSTVVSKLYDLGKVSDSDWALSYSSDGSLWGKFTVSGDPLKKVRFSKGNLYHADSWEFEDDQNGFTYNYGSYIDSGGTEYYDVPFWLPSHNGLFLWTGSTFYANDATGYEIDNEARSSFFANTSEVMGNNWVCLSKPEWNFLLKERTGYAELTGTGEVDGIRGLFILPDTFVDPMRNNGANKAFIPIDSNADYPNNYSDQDWQAMEVAGAVFLPEAGRRYYEAEELNNVVVDDVSWRGYYWTATPISDDRACYCVSFEGTCVEIGTKGYYEGLSVRLVTFITE